MAGGDRSDDAIEQDIRARLTWDPEIEGGRHFGQCHKGHRDSRGNRPGLPASSRRTDLQGDSRRDSG